jgi:serine protease AprX
MRVRPALAATAVAALGVLPIAAPAAADPGTPPAVGAHRTGTLLGAKWNADGDPTSLLSIEQSAGVPTAWARNITGKGIGVALIDSGVAPVPGLDDRRVVNGPDLSFESQAPSLRNLDTFGHGTHMAGIIAGRDAAKDGKLTDDKNFVGVAPDATLVSLKVAAADGAVDVTQVIAAINWAVAHRNDPGLNIRVINLSYGTDSLQDPKVDPLASAAEAAWRSGIVVVAAAGNAGARAPRLTMPAVDPYVIAVGAADGRNTAGRADDVVADFSNRGNASRSPDLVAAGRSVVSLRDPNSYIDANYPTGLLPTDKDKRFFRGSGTSQATAVVSGAAALLLQQRPNLTPDQVKKLLTGTADAMPAAAPGKGAGQLNVGRAVAAPAPVATQNFPRSTGTGSVEKSRGTSHVADATTGAELTGERDIMGSPWSPTAWSATPLYAQTWSGHTWSGQTWSAHTWSDACWSGHTWSGHTWSGHTWAGQTWSGSNWSSGRWR